MPFDGTTIETPAQRRAVLIDMLRNEMPANFIWDYRIGHDTEKSPCGTVGCAMGLMKQMGWIERAQSHLAVAALGISEEHTLIFSPFWNGIDRVIRNGPFKGCYAHHVTPAMVADRLEAVGRDRP